MVPPRPPCGNGSPAFSCGNGSCAVRVHSRAGARAAGSRDQGPSRGRPYHGRVGGKLVTWTWPRRPYHGKGMRGLRTCGLGLYIYIYIYIVFKHTNGTPGNVLFLPSSWNSFFISITQSKPTDSDERKSMCWVFKRRIVQMCNPQHE